MKTQNDIKTLIIMLFVKNTMNARPDGRGNFNGDDSPIAVTCNMLRQLKPIMKYEYEYIDL